MNDCYSEIKRYKARGGFLTCFKLRDGGIKASIINVTIFDDHFNIAWDSAPDNTKPQNLHVVWNSPLHATKK